jgi:integrase
MASAEKLPSGRWRGIYYDSAGKKQRVKGTFELKKDARDAAQDVEVTARRQAAAKKGTLSPRTTWSQWWDVLALTRKFESDNDFTEARIVENYLRPRWGDTQLNRIEHAEVQEWVEELRAGTAISTVEEQRPKEASYVQRIFSVFSASITIAVDKKILTASPTAKIRLPKRPRKPKTIVTPAEAEKLAKHLNEVYRDAVDLIAETGMRPNELAGLHDNPERIDLEGGWLIINECYVFRKKMIRGFPKDKEAREVPLTAKAIEIIKRRRAARVPGESCGIPHMRNEKCKHDLLFRGPAGGVLNRDILAHHMRNAAESAGTPSKSGYSLRRGWATELGKHLDIFTLADYMGHSDINQTRDYVQKTDDRRARYLAAMGEKPKLSIVDGNVGQRGTQNGTDSDSPALPDTPPEKDQDVG